MCGIAGFTHLRSRPDPTRIRRATTVLAHRGPDQQGVWESDTVSLGAVRLRIIDLAGGEQPIVTEDGDCVIVFNGEIYNHAELRDELERLGHRFRSRSDTEVVLRAFVEWDRECLPKLRGMFAVALWKQSERRLLLARDRMGIKPLYIHRHGDDLYFGSELKSILDHPEIERRLDINGLNQFLSLNWVPCPHTLVDGIEKLPPGWWMEWHDGRVTSDAWWRLEMRPRRRRLEEAKGELHGLLDQSVRDHLISDVPLGIWASGGLDSTTILHYAANATSSTLKTFSVSFRGQSFDESGYFREVAGVYGTDHHEFDLNPQTELRDAIEELAWYSDEPSADAGALPVWFLSKMSRRHVTVALSGEGADELFGGYVTYLADRYAAYAKLVPEGARRLMRAILNRWPVSDDKVGLDYKLKRFLDGSLLSRAEAHQFWNGTFDSSGRARVLADGLFRMREPVARGATGLNDFLYADQLNYLPDDILYKCDRMSMAHSLEVRPPFLDHRIVEFAASLPEDLKIRGSRLKFVLRELMSDKLPRAVLERKKEGFDIPAHAWFRGCLKPLLQDTLTPRAVAEAGIFQWREVERVMRDHLERRANLGYHLWGLVTLHLWMKRWRVRLAEPRPAEIARPAFTTN